jgi:hypothetical protein
MKKLVAAFALLLAAVGAPAHAAIQTLTYQYGVTFADASLVPATGLDAGSQFGAIATYDDALLDASGSAPVSSLSVFFGPYTRSAADDLFGTPVISVGPGNSFAGLLFDTTFTVTGGVGAGTYLLSFFGNEFQVTPEGNTVDFKMTGVAPVPVPAALPLLLSGLGVFGWLARRRRAS